MKIAVLGATSEIARDLIRAFSSAPTHECVLFARRPKAVRTWQIEQGFSTCFATYDFSSFGEIPDFDVIINFVGIGDPATAARMGASILDVTSKYDDLALRYLHSKPSCRYIFLSSGAAYGDDFDRPVTIDSRATFPVNSAGIGNWYSIAKFYAEMRHRALPSLLITDIRVFSYISRYQNPSSRFLVMDMLRAIKSSSIFRTADSNIIRDYLSPADFCRIVTAILKAPSRNVVIDCFSKAPVDKYTLLKSMSSTFGLAYEFESGSKYNHVTGPKANYYSTNYLAAEFGYEPQKTALEAVIDEVGAILGGKAIPYPTQREM